MALTIEELSERLEAEIAARELLEKKLASQGDSIANVENRLAIQLNAATSSLESHIQNTDGLVQAESGLRDSEDEAIRSVIATNAAAISAEIDARKAADESLQQQLQENSSGMSALESSVDDCVATIKQAKIDAEMEHLDRLAAEDALNGEIQTAKEDFAQKVSTLQSSQETLRAITDSLRDSMDEDDARREAMNMGIQSNAENIDVARQRIDSIMDEMSQMNNRFVDEVIVQNMINDSISGELDTQLQAVQSMMAQDRESRENDLSNIQDYAARAQNASEQSQSALDAYREESQAAVASMRNAFNLLLPKGTILPYAGDILHIPDGWRICNGANGTPDLVGKVLVGAHAVTEGSDEFAFGSEGGEKEVVLDSGNMPPHHHFVGTIAETNKGSFFIDGYETGGAQSTFGNVKKHKKLWGVREWTGQGGTSYLRSIRMIDDASPVNVITSDLASDGTSKSHNNMPPYRCIYYIMKMF